MSKKFIITLENLIQKPPQKASHEGLDNLVSLAKKVQFLIFSTIVFLSFSITTSLTSYRSFQESKIIEKLLKDQDKPTLAKKLREELDFSILLIGGMGIDAFETKNKEGQECYYRADLPREHFMYHVPEDDKPLFKDLLDFIDNWYLPEYLLSAYDTKITGFNIDEFDEEKLECYPTNKRFYPSIRTPYSFKNAKFIDLELEPSRFTISKRTGDKLPLWQNNECNFTFNAPGLKGSITIKSIKKGNPAIQAAITKILGLKIPKNGSFKIVFPEISTLVDEFNVTDFDTAKKLLDDIKTGYATFKPQLPGGITASKSSFIRIGHALMTVLLIYFSLILFHLSGFSGNNTNTPWIILFGPFSCILSMFPFIFGVFYSSLLSLLLKKISFYEFIPTMMILVLVAFQIKCICKNDGVGWPRH